MKNLMIALSFLFSLQAMSSTIIQEFKNPLGNVEQIKIREEAIGWVDQNVQGLYLLTPQKALGLHYITSLFYERLTTIDAMRPIYDELYRQMAPGDLSYAPFFVKEGIKIVILAKDQNVTDFPEYAHWRGRTVEDVFGYRGDHRSMDTIDGEATRNTCLLKEFRVSKYPRGSSNTYYHEFAHFLHMTTMTPDEFWTVERLYVKARSRNAFLDDYAAQSVMEYFAQGLEAYIAETKTRADRLGRYTKNDRNDLKKIDEELFHFIDGLIEQY